MSAFDDLESMEPLRIWEGVAARAVHGGETTMAVVELDPGSLVPEHRHANEQLGLVLRGSVSFRVADETRDLGPGSTWRISPDLPHEVRAGPEGAVVVDVFSPPRADWAGIERDEPRAPRWPSSA
ncbi:MAG TPA: cupin domain-containing protein [Gaiellaceae bacterium]|nr:cupin domain-containing protein [Gaiellaceae bacterium]